LAKDHYVVRDAFITEDLAAKKYEFYAQHAVDPKVKGLFQEIAQVQRRTAQEFQQLMGQFPS
jgi:rubrerythrin